MSLRVVLHPAAEKDLRGVYRKNRQDFERIVRTIERYAETERGDVKVILPARGPGEAPLLRLRVGNWRIYFKVAGEVMWIGAIEKRSTAYQPWVVEAARRRLRELGVEMG
jgi:mRNA-degrading endonuclease RelE of RelBE toxin-antitoxin system